MNPVLHPTPRQLHSFALGRLDDAVAEPIDAHLAACESCRDLALATPADGLVSLLRAGTAAPESSLELSVIAPSSEPLPERIGRYPIIRRLGQGGMGTVYLAEDAQLGRRVALKVPRFGPDARPHVVERFKLEARIVAGLRHPNLCPIFEVGTADGSHYLTMPFIEGPTLADLLADPAPLPPGRSAFIVSKLAKALAEAHRHGVVHRDLKPSNVLIDLAGEPILLDFGLARRDDAPATVLTKPGVIVGTPQYMAPEQVLGESERIGPATDVYGLGAMLYEMLAGRPPFRGSEPAVLGMILAMEPLPPSQVRKGVDPALERICLKAMCKSIEARYASCADLAAALAEFEQQSVGQRGQSPASRRLLAAGAAALIGLFALGVNLWLMTRDGVIRLELNDPTASIEVRVNDDVIDIAGLDQPLRLKPGKHVLTVTGKDFETLAQEFTVRRGANPVLKATLVPKSVAKIIETPAETKSPLAVEFVKVRDLLGHAEQVGAVAFAADGRRAITGSSDRSAIVWSIPDGAIVARLAQHDAAVTGVALSSDGRRALTASADRTVGLWDVDAGRHVHRFTGHTERVRAVAFAPRGTLAASAGDDHTIRLLDIDKHVELKCLTEHRDVVASLAFAPDGTRLVSGSHDKTARIWELPAGKPAAVFTKHNGWVRSVAFAPDGQRVLSGSGGGMVGAKYIGQPDASVRLWEAATGRELLKIADPAWGGIACVDFLSDGRHVLFSEWKPFRQDRFLFLWDLDKNQAVSSYQDPDDWAPIVSHANNGACVLIGRSFRANTAGHLLKLPGRGIVYPHRIVAP